MNGSALVRLPYTVVGVFALWGVLSTVSDHLSIVALQPAVAQHCELLTVLEGGVP